MIQKYTEKIRNQWYETTTQINDGKLSRKMYPLMARIFGKKEYAEDVETFPSGNKKNEIYCSIYKGKIYIYKEIITTRIKIEDPYQDAKRYFINDNTIKGSE